MYTPIAQTNFAVQPMSVRQAEGLKAVFECLHPGGETSHDWFVNGTFLSSLSPIRSSDIVSSPSLEGSPGSLTILARPEYNNTVVRCRAIVVVNGTADLALSDIAHLTVQGKRMPTPGKTCLHLHISRTFLIIQCHIFNLNTVCFTVYWWVNSMTKQNIFSCCAKNRKSCSKK